MGAGEVRPAVSAEDVERVRGLMREYGAYLAGSAANICIAGLEEELEELPGAYVAPGGLWLGWVDGTAVGCVALKPVRPRGEVEGGLALEVKRLWVRAEVRGAGLGRRLMQAAVDHARLVGAGTVYLDTVRVAMPEANALYAAMGFAPVARYNDNAVNGVEFFALRVG
ncbi:MAG: GNAT family N-acetyltransferase [Acidobacteriaceae bacterium]